MTPSFRLLRRNLVQVVIRLANGYDGGIWELVNVVEGDERTVLDFEVMAGTSGVRDYETTRTVHRFRVAVELIEEDPEVSSKSSMANVAQPSTLATRAWPW